MSVLAVFKSLTKPFVLSPTVFLTAVTFALTEPAWGELAVPVPYKSVFTLPILAEVSFKSLTKPPVESPTVVLTSLMFALTEPLCGELAEPPLPYKSVLTLLTAEEVSFKFLTNPLLLSPTVVLTAFKFAFTEPVFGEVAEPPLPYKSVFTLVTEDVVSFRFFTNPLLLSPTVVFTVCRFFFKLSLLGVSVGSLGTVCPLTVFEPYKSVFTLLIELFVFDMSV